MSKYIILHGYQGELSELNCVRAPSTSIGLQCIKVYQEKRCIGELVVIVKSVEYAMFLLTTGLGHEQFVNICHDTMHTLPVLFWSTSLCLY